MQDKKRARLAGKLDEITANLTKIRDRGICQFCHKPAPDGDRCHVVPKDNGCSWRRWDLLNMVWGHRDCHASQHAGIAGFEIEKTVTVEVNTYLDRYRGGKVSKISTAEMEELYAKYQKMERSPDETGRKKVNG